MNAWVWESGLFKKCNSIPISDRGFRYGMSVFESIMIRGGCPCFLSEHLQRLAEAVKKCGFHSEPLEPDSIKALLQETVSEGLARIYVTAGDGGVSMPANHCRTFVFVEPRSPLGPDVYLRGYHLALSKEIHSPIFGGLKTANYWTNLAALNLAHPKNESLLFNPDGDLISACMANVFVIQNGEIKTPTLSCGARNGVTRDWVIQRRKVTEARLTRNDLKTADSIFLTSSGIGIMPITALEESPVFVDPIIPELHQEFLAATSL